MKIFKEEQRFTQAQRIFLLAITIVIPLVIFFNNGQRKVELIELFFILFGLIVTGIIIFVSKLKTRIDEKGVHFRFFPMQFKDKFYDWQEIDKIYVRKYNALKEYGGWGIKGGKLWSSKNGISYNVSGNIGIQLELKNGEKILIGTKLENEAENVLKTYQNKMTKSS